MRKNWKKALTLVMAAAMAAGLAGCGNGAKQTKMEKVSENFPQMLLLFCLLRLNYCDS